MSHENSHTRSVIEWQRPLLSLQTCNTWSDSCGSHLACSGVNSQVSPTPDEVIIWQAVAATGSAGPQWGTGHPTFPPITHPPPFYPPPHFPAYHPRRQAMSQITFFHALLLNLSFSLHQKYAIFRSNCLTWSLLFSLAESYFLTVQLGMEFLLIQYSNMFLSSCQLNPVMFVNKKNGPCYFPTRIKFHSLCYCTYV